jgi:hypothetical protein
MSAWNLVERHRVSPLLIIALLLVGLYVLTRASDRFGTWVGGLGENVLGRRVDARVARLRATARAANRPPGSPADTDARLRAGLVDFGGALAVGLVFTLFMGFATTTTTYTDGTTESGMALDFSFWLFVLLVLVCYAGIGYRAAEFDDEGQTFGQRLFDYAPRDSGGQRLSKADALKRHMLRLAAAPAVLIAKAQGRSVEPGHDRWTGTSAGTLGEPVPGPVVA